VESFADLKWSEDVRWRELFKTHEYEFSKFNFEESDVELHQQLFVSFEKEAVRLLDKGLVLPGYDYVIKSSHVFNVLDARGAISITERVGYIARVRRLARRAALAYMKQREEMGYPLLPEEERAKLAGQAGDQTHRT
jgi:glycyl-tRNA synthetase alpha chain